MKSPSTLQELQFAFRKVVEQDVKIYISTDPGDVLRAMLLELRPDKVFLISDPRVGKLYADEIMSGIQDLCPAYKIIHNPDEEHKNLEEINDISDAFFTQGGTNKSCVIALGGGITGNIAGLFATLAFRGLPLIHIPTTLLAQVDSAADVKQSVNAGHLKNSIGAYKAPYAVVINPSYCKSLEGRELRSGLGEAIKHGFAQDMNFVEKIVSGELKDVAFLTDVITTAISLKIEHWHHTPTIWNDKKKTERLTHLGHTVGKILEMIQVDYLTHGEAISHGMIIEAYASHISGHLDNVAVTYMQNKLETVGLLYPLSQPYTVKTIVNALYPHHNSQPIFALLQKLGDPHTISTTLPRTTIEEAVIFYLDFLKSKELLVK